MKRLFFFLSSLLLLYLPDSLADMWNPNAQTPVQLYQEAGESASNETQEVTNPPPAPTQPIVKSTQVATPAVLDEQTAELIKQEISQLNRNALMFQQSSDSKIDDLSTQIDGIQKHLKQVAQAFVMLNKEVIRLKELSGQTVSPFSHPSPYEVYFPWLIGMGVLVLILILLILVIVFWRKSRSTKSAPKTREEDDTKDEYDYMGSNEGIPAKLNLARAYIAMEDYPAAKKIIDEVLSLGDEKQRQGAIELAKELPDNRDD